MDPLIIEDRDTVLRRLYPEFFNEDGSLKSTSFGDRNEAPSAHLERTADVKGIRLRHETMMCFGRLVVGTIRSEKLGDVVHHPEPEDASHCLIERRRDTIGERKRRRKLAQLVEILRTP